MIEAKVIGAKIKDARREKGLKQIELAERSGLSNTTICDIEKGRMIPSVDSLFRIASALELSVGFFLPNSYENSVKKLKPTGTGGGE